MIAFAPFAFAYAGMTALCFAMDKRHAQDFTLKNSAARTLALRIIGAALLLASLLFLLHARRHLGLVEWVGALGVSGVVLTLITAYRPRIAFATACVVTIAGLTSLLPIS